MNSLLTVYSTLKGCFSIVLDQKAMGRYNQVVKTLIFSDTHFSQKIDQARLQKLANLIEEADQVIINGDFFDSYLISFSDFLETGWKELFKLLQPKTIYIHGNHDPSHKTDQRTMLFSQQQLDDFDLKEGKYKLHIEHGHRLSPSLDGMWPALIESLDYFYPWWLRFEGELAKKLVPIGWVLDSKRQTKNWQMAWGVKNWPTNHVLIAGHSHLPYQTRHYFNPGRFSTKTARYIWIENGEIERVEVPLES